MSARSDRYSPGLCRAVQATLATLPVDELSALLTSLERRGGQGLTLAKLEMRRRTRAPALPS